MAPHFAAISLALMLILTACGPGQSQGSAGTPTPSSTSVPAATLTPASTPQPTRVQNLAATQQYDEFLARIKEYSSKGYISSTEGSYVQLPEQFTAMARTNYLHYETLTGLGPEFVTSAHIEWSSATDVSEVSGCGFAFAAQPDSYYGVVLDRSRIQFIQGDKNHWSELGKTRGTGRVSFGNPAEAQLTLVVNDGYAYVLVDDELIGEYTLSKDRSTRGDFGYTIISGTNKDFGTRCRITNWRYWTAPQ